MELFNGYVINKARSAIVKNTHSEVEERREVWFRGSLWGLDLRTGWLDGSRLVILLDLEHGLWLSGDGLGRLLCGRLRTEQIVQKVHLWLRLSCRSGHWLYGGGNLWSLILLWLDLHWSLVLLNYGLGLSGLGGLRSSVLELLL